MQSLSPCDECPRLESALECGFDQVLLYLKSDFLEDIHLIEGHACASGYRGKGIIRYRYGKTRFFSNEDIDVTQKCSPAG